MNSKYKYLLKNIGILTIGNFASKILVFLLVPFYTSILSTAEYGTYDLVVSTVQLVFPVFTLNIIDAVMRFEMDPSKPKRNVAYTGLKFITRSCFYVSIALFIIWRFALIKRLSGLELYIFLYYISYVFNQYFMQLAKGMEKIKEIAVGGVINTVAVCLFNILFLYFLKLQLPGFFAAYIIGQFLPCIYYIYKLDYFQFLKGHDKSSKELTKEMLLYCAPLILTTLGWWINNAADKYTVTFMCGIDANGILSVAYKIPSIVTTLHGILIQAWQVSAIKEYDKSQAHFYDMTFATLNFAMTLACSLLIIMSVPLAKVLYSKDFFVAWEYVPFLIVASCINSGSGYLGSILSAEKNSSAMAKAAMWGAGANVVMNIVLVYIMGMQGATIATAISSYIILFLRKKAVKIEIDKKVYRLGDLGWLLIGVQSVVQIYTKMYWLQIILIIFLVFIYRDYVLILWNKVRRR